MPLYLLKANLEHETQTYATLHSKGRREDKLLEQIAQLQKKVSTLSEERDATAHSASKKLAASDALAARAEALAEEAVAGAKDAADLAVAEHIVSQVRQWQSIKATVAC